MLPCVLAINTGAGLVAINDCPLCLEKQRKIDALTEENARLRAELSRRKRKAGEGFFGSSTPSSKIPIKPNVEADKPKRKRGAQEGHVGAGRRRAEGRDDAEAITLDSAHHQCPDCGGALQDKGVEQREVLEAAPVKAKRRTYRLPKKYCPCCRKNWRTKAPGVLPRSLYGNQFIANVIAAHYQHGVPMGRLCEQTGVGAGALVGIFHRLSGMFADLPERLIEDFRAAPVKHADETGWRTNGQNGYVWLFATEQLSLFKFGENRSAKVPASVFGPKPGAGVLVVDRYAGYNKAPFAIQYCYAHLLRAIQDLEKDFPDDAEIKIFVATAAPLLATAIGLRAQNISDKAYYNRAGKLEKSIKAAMAAPAKHLAIRKIQDIFVDNEKRLYHWVRDRRVPADNNLAERDLRPSVIARKVSFGSITDAGAKTRGVLTSLMQTLKKQGRDAAQSLKEALDKIAENPKLNPVDLLFPRPE
jgi:hypothetical protein